MKKRVISASLSLILMLCLLPVQAFAGQQQGEQPGTVSTEITVDELTGNVTTTITTLIETEEYTETTVEITVTDPAGNVLSRSGYTERREHSLKPLEPVPELELEFSPVEEGVTAEASSGEEGTVTEGDADEADGNYDRTSVTTVPREAEGTIGDVSCGHSDDAQTPGAELESLQPKWTGEEADMNIWSTEFDPSGDAPEGYDYYYAGYTGDSDYGIRYINSGLTDYGDVLQFMLRHGESGEAVYAYCLDMSTGTREGWWYDVQNLEDADYYTDEEAKHLRAAALNGYWGASEGTGSLEYMKQGLLDAVNKGELQGMTEADIASLSEGEAMCATQMALWLYGNRLEGDTEYYASNFNGSGDDGSCDKNATEEQKAAWQRIEKVSAYLASLSEHEGSTTELLSPDKFMEEISLIIGDKSEGYEQNTDADDSNDVYDAALSFTLQVSVGENDELYVTLRDGEGKVLKSARLASSGESCGEVDICPQPDGSYRLEGLSLQEGGVKLDLQLQGAQYLEQGVYIYSSELRGERSSQTFVGIAEGYDAVDLQMELSLDFSVNEGSVHTERLMRTQWHAEPGSLHATSPKTGDSMHIWLSMTLALAAALCLVSHKRLKKL